MFRHNLSCMSGYREFICVTVQWILNMKYFICIYIKKHTCSHTRIYIVHATTLFYSILNYNGVYWKICETFMGLLLFYTQSHSGLLWVFSHKLILLIFMNVSISLPHLDPAKSFCSSSFLDEQLQKNATEFADEQGSVLLEL